MPRVRSELNALRKALASLPADRQPGGKRPLSPNLWACIAGSVPASALTPDERAELDEAFADARAERTAFMRAEAVRRGFSVTDATTAAELERLTAVDPPFVLCPEGV